MIICCLVMPVFNAVFINNHTLLKVVGGAHGIFGTIIAVSFFLLIYKTEIKSNAVNSILAKISLASLDMYLCCYIFDAIYYPIFKEHFFVSQQQFGIYFFVIVPLIYISSFALAQVKNLLFKITKLDKLLS